MRNITITQLNLIASILVLFNLSAPLYAQTPHKIIIDPQYGGKDLGPIGGSSIHAKDVTLSIAEKLSKKLKDETKYEVVYTRTADSYVSLQDRVLIANKSGGDVFISIGVNGSKNRNVNGFEIFMASFLNIKGPNNKDFGKKDLELKSIIHDLTLAEKQKDERSRELSTIVHAELREMGLQDRGIKSSPFYVLIGPKMPSIMVMVGFLTNAHDESLLKEPSFQEKVARALFKGLVKYYERYDKTKGSLK